MRESDVVCFLLYTRRYAKTNCNFSETILPVSDPLACINLFIFFFYVLISKLKYIYNTYTRCTYYLKIKNIN